MADQDTGLPIRSEADGTDERVHIKIVDGVDFPAVNQTRVDSDNNLHVESHGNDPTGVDRVLRLSELGALTPDGLYSVTDNTFPGTVANIWHTRAVTPDKTNQIFRPTGINSTVNTNVWAIDVAMRDEQGNPYTAANPLPTTSVDSEGTEVNDYDTTAAIAANASDNHDYTVTAATTLKLSQIWVTGSGKIKAEVQVETGVASGVFQTRYVGFNSTATPNIEFNIDENISVAAGVRVRVIRTNRDNQAMDVYSTISGHEIT